MSETKTDEKVIGVLALQGDYAAHRKTLEQGLILPGGESTTIGKLMARIGLDTAIRARAQAGMPLFGTCAGLILLAREIEDRPDQMRLGLMDITVARNAFGRQIDSFEADIPVALEAEAEAQPVRGVFIRAPYVTEVRGEATILGRFRDKIVAVREGNRLGTAFHPELTEDLRLHTLFVRMVAEQSGRK
jgi:pyridoxal 5'-phosphate synthase pdxT subunit